MSACRSCDAAIVWAKSVKTERSMPFDAEPVDPGHKGALVLVDGWAYWPPLLAERLAKSEGVSTSRALEVIAERYPWHLSHFSTCPNSDQHRSRA